MNIIEWFNENVDAGDAILFALVAFVVWFAMWHLFVKQLLVKCSWGYDLVNMGRFLGPCAAFGILMFFSVVLGLFVASVQAVFTIGVKMLFPLLLFWGGIIALSVFFIKHIKK